MKTMKKTIAIDSNSLSFFVDAIDTGYDPTLDSADLSAERVAMLRIYFYVGEPYYIVPTVENEYRKIIDSSKRTLHEEVHAALMLDFTFDIDEDDIIKKTKLYYGYHPDAKDCRILAEAELGGINILLTFDKRFVNRLKKNNIILIQPSEYWKKLNIAPGTRPIVSPHKTNPLSQQKWWIV